MAGKHHKKGAHYISLFSEDKKLGLCEKCGFVKVYAQNRDRPTCSIRVREANKNRYRPEKMRDQRLRWKYGISNDDYLLMLKIQDGRCLICERSGLKLVVDHDHSTGEVRGLLCSNCNTALGLFADSTWRMAKGIDYLTARKATEI